MNGSRFPCTRRPRAEAKKTKYRLRGGEVTLGRNGRKNGEAGLKESRRESPPPGDGRLSLCASRSGSPDKKGPTIVIREEESCEGIKRGATKVSVKN